MGANYSLLQRAFLCRCIFSWLSLWPMILLFCFDLFVHNILFYIKETDLSIFSNFKNYRFRNQTVSCHGRHEQEWLLPIWDCDFEMARLFPLLELGMEIKIQFLILGNGNKKKKSYSKHLGMGIKNSLANLERNFQKSIGKKLGKGSPTPAFPIASRLTCFNSTARQN